MKGIKQIYILVISILSMIGVLYLIEKNIVDETIGTVLNYIIPVIYFEFFVRRENNDN